MPRTISSNAPVPSPALSSQSGAAHLAECLVIAAQTSSRRPAVSEKVAGTNKRFQTRTISWWITNGAENDLVDGCQNTGGISKVS